MTVKELIEQLKSFDDETPVIFADYEPIVRCVEIYENEEKKSYCVLTDRDDFYNETI